MQNLDDIKLKRFDLHWLIESIPEGFWMLFPIGRWYLAWCLCGEILSRCFNISLGVVRSLPVGPRPSWSSG